MKHLLPQLPTDDARVPLKGLSCICTPELQPQPWHSRHKLRHSTNHGRATPATTRAELLWLSYASYNHG
eukprot:1153245-Pelagomonas_calceolata.AAC.11